MRSFTLTEKLSLAFQFSTQSRRISRVQINDQSDVREYQFRKIKRLLNIAFHHTEFYRDKYSRFGINPRDIRCLEDFAHLPTVTKSELIDAGFGAVNNKMRPDRLIASRSSGSTGQFLTIHLDAQALITQALQAHRMLHEVTPGYRAFDKEILVYTSEYPYSSIGGFYPVTYVSTLLPPEQVLDTILRARPAVLAIYPSILREALELDGHAGMRRHLKSVITNSEYSTQDERDLFADRLGCPVSDEFSSEELSSIAYQCLHKRYHLTQDASYIEILRPGSPQAAPLGEVGEIVGTCLINSAMPIIRYHQDDLAVLDDGPCACGRSAPALRSLAGRKNTSFIQRDGSLIPSGRILDWTYSLILKHGLGIRQFKVTQEEIDTVTIDLVVTNSYDAPVHNRVLQVSFRELFGDTFIVNPRIVSKIERSSSGKYNAIQSNVGIQAQLDGIECTSAFSIPFQGSGSGE